MSKKHSNHLDAVSQKYDEKHDKTNMKPTNELISVIIPVYNVRPYIREALNSIINQTYKQLEIIIIDDGSTDGSGEICDQYALKDKRIQVIHQRNQGLSAARNYGLDHITGKAIVFLDSDDAYHPNAIWKMVSVLVNESADVVACGAVDYITDGSMNIGAFDHDKNRNNQIEYSRDEALRAVIDGSISCGAWGKIYRSKVWRGLRYPVGHVYEDYYIIFDVLERTEKVITMEEPLVMHRIRENSITKTITLRNIQDRSYAREHYVDYIMNHIPVFFSDNHLQKVMEASIRRIIISIVSLPLSNNERNEIRTFLQNELEKYRRKVSGKPCRISTILMCLIYDHFEWILKSVYYVCHYFRKNKTIRLQ